VVFVLLFIVPLHSDATWAGVDILSEVYMQQSGPVCSFKLVFPEAIFKQISFEN